MINVGNYIWFHYTEDIVHMCYVITNSISYGHSMSFDGFTTRSLNLFIILSGFGHQMSLLTLVCFNVVASGGYDQN